MLYVNIGDLSQELLSMYMQQARERDAELMYSNARNQANTEFDEITSVP